MLAKEIKSRALKARASTTPQVQSRVEEAGEIDRVEAAPAPQNGVVRLPAAKKLGRGEVVSIRKCTKG